MYRKLIMTSILVRYFAYNTLSTTPSLSPIRTNHVLDFVKGVVFLMRVSSGGGVRGICSSACWITPHHFCIHPFAPPGILTCQMLMCCVLHFELMQMYASTSQVNPYLNRGLNHFQRLALITQFITCLSGIIYLMVGCLDDLHEVSPSQPAKDASFLLTIVVFGLNWLTAVLYPAYRYISISPNFPCSCNGLSF